MSSGGNIAGRLLDPLGVFTKHGGGSSPAAAINAAPVPIPAPPVTATAPEVLQAEHDVAQANLLKKSIKRTIVAGDTGGYSPMGQNPANASGGPSLSFVRGRS